MEFDSVIVKDSPGLCRCCLAEGCYKELGAPYFCGGHTEVYGDMLMECFDICISQQTDGPNGPNRHICEVCIGRLRDATEFKRQVLESEKTFIDMVARKDFKGKMMVGKKEMKKEPGTDVDPDVNMIDTADVFDDDTDEEPLSLKRRAPRASGAAPRRRGVKTERKKARKNDESEEELLSLKSGDEGVDAAPLATPRRASEVKTEKRKRIKKKTEDAASSNKVIGIQRRRNLQILFNNTSVIPFKWRSKFSCFYCGLFLNGYKELRRHTEAHGSCSLEEVTAATLKLNWSRDIKVDISDLTCQVCKDTATSFYELITHLNDRHDLSVDPSDLKIETLKLSDMSCHMCGQKFNYIRFLISHLQNSHPNEESHECDKCNQKFNRKKDLCCHMSYYHREGGYQCKYCPVKCDTLNSLRYHKAKYHSTRCGVCFVKFGSPTLKQKHLELVHPEKAKSAKIPIVKDEDSKRELRESRESKRGRLLRVKTNICDIINMSNATPFSYYKNKFNCFYCPEDFIDPETLRDHTQSNHTVCDLNTKYIKKNCTCLTNVCVKLDILHLRCRLCQIPLTDFDSLLDHLTTVHDVTFESMLKSCLQPYKLVKDHMECPYCPGEVFRFFNILAKHVNSSHTNNNIVCSYCGLTFAKETHLRVHIRNNHRQGMFRCPICDAECNIQSRLFSHLAKVHGKKALRCLKCGERFETHYLKQRHLLNVHNMGHKCPHCERVFHRNSYMKDHVRRFHLKEKKVPCSACDMKFFSPIDLRSHMVKHTGEKNFHCDICGERFMYKKGLVRHIGRHNKNASAISM